MNDYRPIATDAPAKRPRGWIIAPGGVRALLSGHGALGLSLGALIYLVCLTGTLAVFAHQLQHWEQPSIPTMATIAPDALDRALATAIQTGGTEVTYYVSLPSQAEWATTIYAYTPAAEHVYAVAADGSATLRETPWTEFLINLHVALHLPRTWGGFLVGVSGVALLSTLISGVLAHPRLFRDAFQLRRGGSRRLQDADLHNRLGVWALPFHAVIALSGAMLGLGMVAMAWLSAFMPGSDAGKGWALFADAPPALNAAPAPLPRLAPLLAIATARMPGAPPSRFVVERPGRADARVTIIGQNPRTLAEQDQVVFDSRGRMVSERHPFDQVAGTLLLGGMMQLHFGWFAALAGRVVYGLLGLGLCVLASTGMTIWLARGRDKGRAAPAWERVWAAVAWGQPLALALAALAAVTLRASEATLVALWLGATVVTIAAAASLRRVDAGSITRALRLTLGAALVLLAAWHLARFGVSASALLVDATVLAGGVWLIRGQLRARGLASRVA